MASFTFHLLPKGVLATGKYQTHRIRARYASKFRWIITLAVVARIRLDMGEEQKYS